MSDHRPTLSSSTHLEELLNHTSAQDQHSWLMSYLDVFILLLMLIITLVSITEIQTEQSQSAQTQSSVGIAEAKLIQDAQTEQSTTLDFKETAEHKQTNITPEENQQAIEKNTDNLKEKNNENSEKNKQWQEEFKQQLETLGIAEAISLQFKNSSVHIEIQDNILFNTAEAYITSKGEQVLLPLTTLLKKSIGIIYIEGHTDNRPISTLEFPTNWELGAARALSVLHFLSDEKIPEARLRATTYADTQPISSNNSPEERQKNRRVNLIIKMPDMPQ